MASRLGWVTLMLSTMIGSAAHAGACPGGQLSVTGAGPTLARNGVVLVEIVWAGPEQPAIDHAKLVAAGFSSDVRVIRRTATQTLLAPTSMLPADTKVHLVVGIEELDAQLAKLELTTSTTTDDAMPTWSKPPTVGKRHIVPSNKNDWVDAFAVRVPIDVPSFVIATITSPGSDTPSEVFYRADHEQIEIGATGCYSAWSGRGSFTVELLAMAGSGATSMAPGKPLRLRF